MRILMIVLMATGFFQSTGLDAKGASTGDIVLGCAKTPCMGKDKPSFRFEPVVVPPDRLLVATEDTIYMLGPNRQVLWQSNFTAPLSASPVADRSGRTVYGVTYDLGHFALDAPPGKEKWSHGSNGKAVYTQVKPYGKTQHLIVVDMTGYDDLEEGTERTSPDRIELFDGDQLVWYSEFPAGARLQVWGNQILAIRYTARGIEITEIRP